MIFKWCILVYFIFFSDVGAPKRHEARANLPSRPSPFDGPAYLYFSLLQNDSKSLPPADDEELDRLVSSVDSSK